MKPKDMLRLADLNLSNNRRDNYRKYEELNKVKAVNVIDFNRFSSKKEKEEVKTKETQIESKPYNIEYDNTRVYNNILNNIRDLNKRLSKPTTELKREDKEKEYISNKQKIFISNFESNIIRYNDTNITEEDEMQ